MVRMVHMNIFYRTNLQIQDSKVNLGENSKFRSSKIEKSVLRPKHLLFGVDAKTEMISRYTLDNSEVFPAHFSDMKLLFHRKIDQNQRNSRKFDKHCIKILVWGRLLGSFIDLYPPNVIFCSFALLDFSFKFDISLHNWASK